MYMSHLRLNKHYAMELFGAWSHSSTLHGATTLWPEARTSQNELQNGEAQTRRPIVQPQPIFILPYLK